MFRKAFFALFLLLAASTVSATTDSGAVKIGDIARLGSAQQRALVGYGVVTGLAGTGDSPRSTITVQSIRNMLMHFGVNIDLDNVRTRNSAAVMVTATLPPYAQSGDTLDVNVTSLGDARSLVGGTLMMTPLTMGDSKIYAMAQGALSVGGYSFDMNGNVVQKNHPTSAHIPSGATVEQSIATPLMSPDGTVIFKLDEPNFETSTRVASRLASLVGANNVKALDPARIRIRVPVADRNNVMPFLTKIEETEVLPGAPARVVVNEKTGTVVSGGDVVVSPVTVSHGNLNVAISTEYQVSQPFGTANTVIGGNYADVRTTVVPQSDVKVTEDEPVSITLARGSKIADLVGALNKVKATSRDIIVILQSIKRAGALHAQLIIQ